jgi:alpha-beta hydrolase superfamily lysophospholipase
MGGDVTAELSFLAAADGARLPYRRFAAADGAEPRASVVYLHGIQSHGGWYVDTARELSRRGFTVYLPDRRGSGASTGPRGHFHRRPQLVGDVRTFVELGRREAPGRPAILVGGCWGVRPAVAAARRMQDELAGLALVCPAVKVNVDLTPVEKAKVVAGAVLRPRARVRVPLTPEMFTTNPRWLEFIRTDPLALRDVTARFYFETARFDLEIGRERGLRLPMLLLRSGNDPIIDGEGVDRWFARMASDRKETVIYPEFGHIPDFEEQRARYWDDLASWMERTADAARPGGAP